MRAANDTGSGLVLVLTLAMAVGLGATVLSAAANIQIETTKIQRTADLAAIATDQTRRGLNSGFPCDRAAQIIGAANLNLNSCAVTGVIARVVANGSVVGIVLNATSSAGEQ